MQMPNSTQKRHKADILLILPLFLILLLFVIISGLFRSEGDRVEVTKNGEYIMTISLLEDGEYNIDEGNTIVVEGGEAYMSYADCPDETCILTGRISYVGESIICLPNRVAVTVIGSGGDLIS